jgi:hypothetical protein
MKPTTVLAVLTILLSPVAAASAQDDRPVNFILGGGYTAPNSEVRDHLGDGYNVSIGLQVNVSPAIGIEGLYGFNGLGSKRISIPIADQPGGPTIPTDFFGDMNMQFGIANLVLQKPEGGVRPYGVVGGGVYYRPITVTTPGVGFVPGYCDPWWYICVPGGFVPVENIVGERSSTDFGMDFGGGAKFGAFFADARYHYIWGPEVEGATEETTNRKANGQFFILTFGIKY